MLKEFKEFIAHGSVMDMAVGIIIGAAATALVTSLVDDIISPIIGVFLGGVDFSQLSINVGSAQIMYGNFINAIINFLIIAFVVFMIVRSLNKMRKKQDEEAPAGPSETDLLTEIRDALKGRN